MSGLLGGLAAMGLSHLMRRQITGTYRGRSAESLVREYRWHIRAVGAVFIASLLVGVVAYQRGWVGPHDWRPFITLFGGGVSVPLSLVYLWLGRRRFAEFWVAACVKDRVPLWLGTLLACLCAALFFAGIGGYLLA